MKKTVLFTIFLFLLMTFSVAAQSVVGKWKTIDDETGKEKSIVEIYENGGKVYAKVSDILEASKYNAICTKCDGNNKNKPIKGMVIINGLTKDGDEWNNGKILDPSTGKKYKCYIQLVNPDKLKVRGFIGFALIGRTQYWYRVK